MVHLFILFIFALSGLECSSKGKSCQGKSERQESYHPEFAWSLTSADDVWAEDHGVMNIERGSSLGWEEGKKKKSIRMLMRLHCSTS